MSSLSRYISSDYVAAANRLKGGRQRIVAYVESYDDIAFWRQILGQLETSERYFEVMLPSRTSLAKGKKIALSHQLGPCIIACVDADYDWLLQRGLDGPFVLHTHAYAIENHQCYAPGLHEICVCAALNDAPTFPFEQFLTAYSETIWPLFVWSVWAYAYDRYRDFSLADFAAVVTTGHVNIHGAETYLADLHRRVNQAVSRLQRQFPEGRETYAPLRQSLLDRGVTPDTTYLYMRGHDLMDGVIIPLLDDVCSMLRRQREREICRLAAHNRQQQNELSAYRHACAPVEQVLRKHTAYTASPLYQAIIQDAKAVLQ